RHCRCPPAGLFAGGAGLGQGQEPSPLAQLAVARSAVARSNDKPFTNQAYITPEKESTMIIEWGRHVFSSDTARYPIHPRATYVPGPERFSPDPLSDYLADMQEHNIDRAVLVHPEPYGDDHRLVLDCLEREPERFRATALYYPRDKDAPDRLRDLVAQQPKIVGIRFHATSRDRKAYLDSFDDPGVVALWKTAAELGLIVELHIGPYYARQVVPLITEYAETPVIIDHL